MSHQQIILEKCLNERKKVSPNVSFGPKTQPYFSILPHHSLLLTKALTMYRHRNDKDEKCVSRDGRLLFTVIAGELLIHFLTECTNYTKLREQFLQEPGIIYPKIPHQTNEGKHFGRDLLPEENSRKKPMKVRLSSVCCCTVLDICVDALSTFSSLENLVICELTCSFI